MILVPVIALAILVTVVMGGPAQALAVTERMFFDVWDTVVVWLHY
jgi:hypothetical protein